jgi:hypothetical protein
VNNILQSGALTALCLAVASGLGRLEEIDNRTLKHSAALRRLLPPGQKSLQDDELAPHAPQNWTEFKPRPFDPEHEKDTGYDKRLAQRWRYIPRPTKNRVSSVSSGRQ